MDNPFLQGGSGGSNPFVPNTGTGDPTGGFQFSANPGTSNSPDSSVDSLLQLAQFQGGSIAEAANSMVHPETSILSTIGNGFKNAFKDFVDVLSVPSEAVAGAMSSQYSVSDAIAKHIRPSDVIFGQADPTNSTMQKVGSFLVRTATDVLLDPLTYLTFGAGQGVFGLRATSEITLGESGAAALGKEAAAQVSLSGAGQDMYKTLSGLARQGGGTALAEVIKTGDQTMQLAGKELQHALEMTIDAPLDADFAKTAMTNLLEKYPQLTETLVDKGGMKLFGQTVLSGQRISSAIKFIPGMTILDQLTKPARTALGALFDPALVKDGQQYIRLPGEAVDITQKAKDLAASLSDSRILNFENVVKANNLSETETHFLFASIEAGKMPINDRLANAYKQLTGFNDNELQYLRAKGIPIARLDNHVPHVLVKTKTANIPFKLPPGYRATAAIHRKMEGAMFGTAETIPKELEPLAEMARGAKGVEDFTAQAGKDIPEGMDAGKFFKQANTSISELEKAVVEKDTPAVEQIFKDIKNEGFEIFDQNAVTAMVRRSLDNVRVGVSRDFMKSMASHFGLPASEAPAGWVPVTSRGMREAGKEATRTIGFDGAGKAIDMSADSMMSGVTSKEGEALYYHPAIAKHIEGFVGSVINDDATKDFLKHYDSIQNLWKASVTSIFPAFHGRNAISNVLQNLMDIGYHALNPKTHALAGQLELLDHQAGKLMLDAMKPGATDVEKNAFNDLLTKKVFTDKSGYDWSFGELRNAIKDHNIAFSSKITSSVDVTQTADEMAKNLFPSAGNIATGKRVASKVLPTSQNFLPFQVGRDVGNAIESQARLVNFLSNLHNTGDVTLAAKRTKQFLFDYGSLTNFERTFLRRIIPFYSYTRKNLELQAHSLLTTPGRTVAQIQGLQNLSDVLSGGQLTPDQEAALPDWIKSGIEIVRSKQGNNVSIISSLGTPIEQPFQAFQPNQLLGSISPLLRVPLEQATGYSLYQGKMLSDVTNASAFKNAPDAVKYLIGYTSFTGHRSDGKPFQMEVALHPEMMNLILNLPPTSRVLSAMKQMDAVDVSDQDKIMQQLIGSKPYSFDVQQEAQKRANAQKLQLENMLTKAGVLAHFNSYYVPKKKF